MRGIVYLVATGASWIAVGAAVKAIGRRGLSLALYQSVSACMSFAVAGAMAAADPASATLPKGVGTGVWTGVVIGSFAYGLLNCAMLHYMGKAMQRGSSAIVWSIVQSGFIYPFLMAWVVFREPVGAGKVAGMALILASVAIYGRGAAGGRQPSADAPGCGAPARSYLAPALLGMLFCGLNQCGGSLPSHLPRGNEFPPVFRTVLCSAGILCGNIPLLVREAKSGAGAFRRGLGAILCLAILCQIISFAANVFLLFPGLDLLEGRGMLSIGFPVAVASSIVFFFIYSALVLRERITPLQAAGGAIGIAGIAACCL